MGNPDQQPETQEDVRAWRRARRDELLALRARIVPGQRAAVTASITAHLLELEGDLLRESVGFYLAMRGEVDLLPLLKRVAQSGQVSLPVITPGVRALRFQTWRPGEELVSGPYGTSQPVRGDVVIPTVLLLPLVGFDGAGFRLGYGGGYYDRTLAALEPHPRTIGIGFAGTELLTIHPQPYDQSLDHIVTELGVTTPYARS